MPRAFRTQPELSGLTTPTPVSRFAHRSKYLQSTGEKRPLTSLVRSNIQDLTPYRCARDDYSDGVLLDANENSFGPALALTQVGNEP